MTLPARLHGEARDMGIDRPQSSERGLTAAVSARGRQRWPEDNEATIAAWNEHVAEHGLPLAAYRKF